MDFRIRHHFSLAPRATQKTALFTAIFFSFAAHSSDTIESQKIEIIEVLNHSQSNTLAPRALPTNTTIIDAEEIMTTNIGKDISNIFRRVPGVVANSIDQGDTGTAFRMRGFATQLHGADTAIYVDGVPHNLPSSESGSHGPAFIEWLSPSMIGNVEVIKGPISVLHGDQNRAGAVNIDTVSKVENSSIGISLESYGGQRGTLVLSKQIGQVDNIFIADTLDADSFRDETETHRDNFFWKGSTAIGDGIYSLSVNHYSSDFTNAGFLSYQGLVAHEVEPEAVQEGALPGFGDNTQSGIVFNRRPQDSEFGLYATLYGLDIERQRGIPASGLFHYVGEDDRKVFGGRLATNLSLNDNATVLFGVDYRLDKGDAVKEQYEDHVATGNYYTNLDLDLMTYGMFVQTQYWFAPNWQLTAGLRYDRFDYSIVNRKFTDADVDYSRGIATPKIGITWNAAPSVQLFANAAEGFRSPSAQQLTTGGALGGLGQTGGVINDDISASKIRSYDAGFSADIRPDLILSASGFYIENDDEITFVGDNQYETIGESTRKGYEFDVHFQPMAEFNLYASYTRVIKATLDNASVTNGKEISVPETTAKMGATYNINVGLGELAFNADAYVISGIPYYIGSPLVRHEMPTFTRYDLRVSYTESSYEVALFWTLQPQKFASEAAYASSSALMIAPQPNDFGGISFHYMF